jgi:hypothetical protein
MAFAIARSLSWRSSIAAAVVLGVFAAAVPATGAEPVYVWRDANGAVQFSTVAEQRETDVANEPCDPQREYEPRLAVNDARE